MRQMAEIASTGKSRGRQKIPEKRAPLGYLLTGPETLSPSILRYASAFVVVVDQPLLHDLV